MHIRKLWSLIPTKSAQIFRQRRCLPSNSSRILLQVSHLVFSPSGSSSLEQNTIQWKFFLFFSQQFSSNPNHPVWAKNKSDPVSVVWESWSGNPLVQLNVTPGANMGLQVYCCSGDCGHYIVTAMALPSKLTHFLSL